MKKYSINQNSSFKYDLGYGIRASIAGSSRMDFGAHYTRLMKEILHYANEGTKFMMDKGWIEHPPLSVEREAFKN
jgi:hypothetical protein